MIRSMLNQHMVSKLQNSNRLSQQWLVQSRASIALRVRKAIERIVIGSSFV